MQHLGTLQESHIRATAPFQVLFDRFHQISEFAMGASNAEWFRIWLRSVTCFTVTEHTYLLCKGKYHCTAGLFDWFGFNQTSKCF